MRGAIATAQQRPFAAFDEREHGADVFAVLRQVAQLHQCFVELRARNIQRAIRALDRRQSRRIEAAALEALGVDAARPAVAFLRDHDERRHVAVDERAHADEGVVADAAELVHADEAAEDHLVADFHVPGERGVVREHALVADDAIVRHVHVGQQPVAVADAGDAAAGAGAAADGREFAHDVVVADVQLGALAREFLVLRVAADRGVPVEMVALADAGGARHRAVRAEDRVVADLDPCTDHAVRTDAHVRAEARRRVDHRGGMQRAHLSH